MKIPSHPLANLFPPLPDEDQNDLADDIKLNGLIHPIITYEGQVLDGRHRYNACLEVDVEPKFEEYKGKNPVAFVVSSNLNRRHLTASQRAMVAAKLENMPVGNPEILKSSKTPMISNNVQRHNCETKGNSRESVAAECKVSSSSVARASKILDESPKLAKEVANGHMTVRGAVAELAKQKAKSEPEEFDEDEYPIPAKILPLWKRAEAEAKTAMQMVVKLKALFSNASETKDIAFAEIRFQENDRLLETLYSNLKLILPHGVCTSCQGKLPDKCTLCKGRGFLSGFAYQMYGSAEVKEIRKKMRGLK